MSYGKDLGEKLGVRSAPAIVNREISDTKIRSNYPCFGVSKSTHREDAFLTGLQLRHYPHHELGETVKQAELCHLHAADRNALDEGRTKLFRFKLQRSWVPAMRRKAEVVANPNPNRTPGNANSEEPVVLVVDDDASVCIALENLLSTVHLHVESYNSAQTFLQAQLPGGPSCLVLDVRMPGQSGLDLQKELIREDVRIPIIFMTGYGDVPMSVKALKAGAMDFLIKPFDNQEMLDAVHAALRVACKWREEEKRLTDLRSSFEALTPRERQIMMLVTHGLLNKQVAHELSLSEITVKIHRGSVMRKMSARSLPDLVRKAEALGLRKE